MYKAIEWIFGFVYNRCETDVQTNINVKWWIIAVLTISGSGAQSGYD